MTGDPRLGRLGPLALFGAFLALAAAYAALLGGFRQEFLSDASIHYVTTLETRDYLLHGLPGSPLRFLDDYYRHYPLAGFGLWPPLYYGLSGLWTLAFGGGRASIALLSAALSAAGSLALALSLRRRLGLLPALFAGVVLALMPAQSAALRTMLIDPLCGLLCFVAALAFADYLAARTTRSALLFALAALAAVFTKGNALLLGLLPPLAIAFTGEWRVLRDWRLWLAGAIVGVIAAPWYLFTAGFAAQGFRYAWGVPFFLEAVPGNLRLTYDNFGPVLLVPIAVGLWATWRARDPWWRTLASLALACFLFQSIVPASLNLRYLFPAFFPLAAFAAAGVVAIARATSRPPLVGAILGGVCLASVLILGLRQFELVRFGLAPAAEAAVRAAPPGSPVLIATSALAEAGGIAELAHADPARPRFYALRGSRLLGGGGYYATDYVPLYATAAQAEAAIDRVAPPLVILERSAEARKWRHVAQVEALIAAHPERWRRLAGVAGEQGRRFELYRLSPPRGRRSDVARVRALNANPVLAAFAR